MHLSGPVAVLTSGPADRRCRRIDSRCSLLGAAVVLVKARYHFADVLLDSGTRHADQRRLNVVPQLPCLRLHGAMTAHGRFDGDSGRWATIGLALQRARKHDPT